MRHWDNKSSSPVQPYQETLPKDLILLGVMGEICNPRDSGKDKTRRQSRKVLPSLRPEGCLFHTSRQPRLISFIARPSNETLDNCWWWRNQMETFSVLLAIYAGNSPVNGEFPAQRPVTRSFCVFFDLRLKTRLSEQSWGWWFETLPLQLWRHCNVRKSYKRSLRSERRFFKIPKFLIKIWFMETLNIYVHIKYLKRRPHTPDYNVQNIIHLLISNGICTRMEV